MNFSKKTKKSKIQVIQLRNSTPLQMKAMRRNYFNTDQLVFTCQIYLRRDIVENNEMKKLQKKLLRRLTKQQKYLKMYQR